MTLLTTIDGARASKAPTLKSPRCPAWLQQHLEPTFQFIAGLTPFPFHQPADTSRFLSLHQNDYLRLSTHPSVREARRVANLRDRTETFSSSVFGGGSPEHARFEARLKDSLQAEHVVLTTAGWTANVGLLDALAPRDLPIYIDVDAHASLHDGVRLSAGRPVVFKHNDPEHLKKRVQIHGPGIVCIDALYSTDGSIADLRRFGEVCAQHECVLVVDEAHSFGMFGKGGGGLVVEQGVVDLVHFRTFSLSKALGGHGGVIAGAASSMLALSATNRPVLFSSATSAVLAAGHDAALAELMRDPNRAAECLRLAERLRAGLHALNVDTCGSASQIVSVFFGPESDACKFYAAMRERRILSSVFVHPAVPAGTSLARFSVYSGLTERDIDHIIASCAEVLKDIPFKRRKA